MLPMVIKYRPGCHPVVCGIVMKAGVRGDLWHQISIEKGNND